MSSSGLLIFDLDGTLVDSLEDIADAMNAALTELGHPTHPYEDFRQFVGEGVARLAERALGTTEATVVSPVLQRYRVHYARNLLDKTKPYSGLLELVRELRSLPVKLAVLSNKPDEPTRTIVHAIFGETAFDAVLGFKDPFPRKPDPTSTLWMMNELGASPEKTVFIGDSAVDLRTAHAAGIGSVAVTWGFRPEDELRAEAPTSIVSSVEVLREKLLGAVAEMG